MLVVPAVPQGKLPAALAVKLGVIVLFCNCNSFVVVVQFEFTSTTVTVYIPALDVLILDDGVADAVAPVLQLYVTAPMMRLLA